MFSISDRHQILTHLNAALIRKAVREGVTPELHTQDDIWNRLNDIEANSKYKVSQVEGVSADLVETELQIKNERTANYGLSKAGDLEWNINEKLSGLEAQRIEQLNLLRYLLGFDPLLPSEGTGTAGMGTLGRS